MRFFTLTGLLAALVVLFILSLPVSPSSGLKRGKYTYNPPPLQNHAAGVSQSPYLRYYLENPQDAPGELRPVIAGLRAAADEGALQQEQAAPANPGLVFAAGRFNKEDGSAAKSMPQNEESVASCTSNPNEVIMGSNDYRGVFSPDGNSTGWHYSRDGGASVFKEGLLDKVTAGGVDAPSGGDPVVRARPAGSTICNYYAASLAFDLSTGSGSGLLSTVAVYSTNSALLSTCTTGAACWPVETVVVNSGADFLDKEWMDVGSDGSSGAVVWVTWTRFQNYSTGSGNSPIEAARCAIDASSGAVSACSPPIPISAPNANAQFSYVTVAPDGATYISWIEIGPGNSTFTIKMRMALPGSTTFGSEIAYTETQALDFQAFLSNNDFRIRTIPANAVMSLGGKNRVYVAWTFCQQPPLVSYIETCRDADIKIVYADDGETFRPPVILAAPGNQYFPSIDVDHAGGRAYLAYYSNEADPWNHRQQVMLANAGPNLNDFQIVALNPAFEHGDLDCNRSFNTIDMLRGLQDIAGLSPLPDGCPIDLNEPDADPVLGGLFIGDYIEVAAENGLAYVGYTANFTQLPFLGSAPPTFQQDNYLAKFTYP